ncbi:MAG TPA: tRNA (adenosine(37)-N6)-threonylcarbamoyltransferase complex transferase subunit TsaD [Tepidisphaeraceae bacterium]|jgi:N6-L-threonylcarbamoyladenine synthase
MSLILAIESTCDETGASIVRDGTQVLSNIVATQTELHAKYRGVVPEIASRAHIENILPVIRESLSQAHCQFHDLDAIAVANRPGLIGSLLIGVTAAKTLAWSLSKPLIAVDHVQAHLYSVALTPMQNAECRVQNQNQEHKTGRGTSVPLEFTPSPCTQGESRGGGPSSAFPGLSGVEGSVQNSALTNNPLPNPPPEYKEREAEVKFPAIGLVCSGGHTALYALNSFTDITRIGSTIDDAVGEAYDKVAAILGLGYPGGPIIDALAQKGDPHAIQFPRTLLEKDSLNFSFSGLKTAVLYHVHGIPQRNQTKDQRKVHALQCVGLLTQNDLQNIAASFQAACVDILIEKLRRAARQYRAKSILIGGGVSANQGLRIASAKLRESVYFPELQFCTDNATMSAGLAHLYFENGTLSPLSLDAIATQ